MQEDLSHARGSVSISCKGFCLWSSSILGPMQGVLSLNKVLLTQQWLVISY